MNDAQCVYCGRYIIGPVHHEKVPCIDKEELGREVTLPFCNRRCAEAYLGGNRIRGISMINKLSTDALKIILEKHNKWWQNEKDGERANLGDANLRGENLRGANLGDANLRGANLRGANLGGANLRGANLGGANLRGAYLRDADLRGTYLGDADLRGADPRGADLRDADLRGADLRGANLGDIKQDCNTKWPWYQIPEGDLIGWKKCKEGIVKLWIPREAKRTASVIGRKCRAEFVVVLETPNHSPARSLNSQFTKIIYTEGETVLPDSYDDNFLVECSNGIHFFATRREAEEFDL